MSEDVSSKVKKIVADHLGIDEAKVTEESSFIDDLGADSLDTVELVMAFEGRRTILAVFHNDLSVQFLGNLNQPASDLLCRVAPAIAYTNTCN